MSRPPAFPEGTTEKMQILLKEAVTASELRRIQSVLLGSQGISSLSIETIVGLSSQYIRIIWRNYRQKGEVALLGEKRGQARGHANLTLKKEEKFLAPFFSEAKKAGILIVSDIHKAYEESHKKINRSAIYKLLHRHGWRKIVPRHSHPKEDKEAQEKFLSTFSPECTTG